MSTSTSYVLTDGVNEQRFRDGKDLSCELNQRCKSTPRDYWCDLKVQITLGESEKLRVWRKAELPPMQAAEWHRQHKEYAGQAFFFWNWTDPYVFDDPAVLSANLDYLRNEMTAESYRNDLTLRIAEAGDEIYGDRVRVSEWQNQYKERCAERGFGSERYMLQTCGEPDKWFARADDLAQALAIRREEMPYPYTFDMSVSEFVDGAKTGSVKAKRWHERHELEQENRETPDRSKESENGPDFRRGAALPEKKECECEFELEL